MDAVHADAAMDAPGFDGYVLRHEGSLPRVDVQIVRVDQGSVHVEQHRRRNVVLGIVKSHAYHRRPLAEQRQRAFARQRVHPDLNTVLNFLVLALDVLVVVGAVRIVFQLDRGH
jgi:hypothetical protein